MELKDKHMKASMIVIMLLSIFVILLGVDDDNILIMFAGAIAFYFSASNFIKQLGSREIE